MASRVLVTAVRFSPAAAKDIGRGFLGWVSFDLGEVLRLEGAALSRAIDGEVVLSFCETVDWRDQEHAVVRPTSEDVRLAIQRDVLHELALQGITLPTGPSPRSSRPREELGELSRALPGDVWRQPAEFEQRAKAGRQRVQAISKLSFGHAGQGNAESAP